MLEERKGIVTMGGQPVTLVGSEIKIGDKGPNFKALTTEMTEYSLDDAGDKIKIISVVPSLDTGVCELQTINFNEMASKLTDVVILTLSVDLPFAQKRFCGAEGIDEVITLSDHKDLDFGEKYGFLMKESRLLSRGIVLLDRDNTVKYVEYVKEVSTHPDYERVLKEAKKLI